VTRHDGPTLVAMASAAHCTCPGTRGAGSTSCTAGSSTGTDQRHANPRRTLRSDFWSAAHLALTCRGRRSYQPKTVGPAFVGVIRIKQRRCLIMAVR
jgi:hypothetical protein